MFCDFTKLSSINFEAKIQVDFFALPKPLYKVVSIEQRVWDITR